MGLTSSLLAIDARSTKHTPSKNNAADRWATCTAKRVLPTPPGPVSVSAGTNGTSATSAATSARHKGAGPDKTHATFGQSEPGAGGRDHEITAGHQ